MPPILFPLKESYRNRGASQRLGVGPSIVGYQPLPAPYLRIYGVTKDSAGSVLASCAVSLFETGTNRYVEQTVSDASGNYEFRSASLSTTYYVVAYKAGAPDVAGTTVNTLIGS